MTETTDAGTLTISRMPVPASADAADAGPFRAMIALGNALCRHDTGHDYFDQTVEEVLPSWQDQTDRLQIGFTAERGGEIVGAATMMVPLEDGAPSLEFDLMADPERWGEGIEEALLAAIEAEARALGRSIVQTWTLHRPDAPGARLPSPTGLGSIPADDRQTHLMQQSGYTFEQAERNSVFDLTGSFDAVERMLAEALDAAGADYRVITWTSPTPDEYKEGFAAVISRMSTDVPTGDLVWTEEKWDAARVERRDKRLLAGGVTIGVACVEHVPTGTHHGLQRTHDRGRSHRTDAPVGHPRHQGAPRASARHDREVREPPALARADAGFAAGVDVQRGGEPAHARHQRGHRLRARVLRGSVEEGAQSGAASADSSDAQRRSLTVRAEVTRPVHE